MTDLSGMVEVVARAISRRVDSMGDTEAVEQQRVGMEWPVYYDHAQAALTALTPHIEKLVEEARGGRADLPEGHDAVLVLRARLKFLCHYDEVWPLVEAAFATRAHSIAPVDDADVVARCRQEAERIVYNRPSSEAVVADVANLLSRLSASGVGQVPNAAEKVLARTQQSSE